MTGTTCTKCSSNTVGKSKYCSAHRKEARKGFAAMLQEQSAERLARYADYEALWASAEAAGLKALESLSKAKRDAQPEAYVRLVQRQSGFARFVNPAASPAVRDPRDELKADATDAQRKRAADTFKARTERRKAFDRPQRMGGDGLLTLPSVKLAYVKAFRDTLTSADVKADVTVEA